MSKETRMVTDKAVIFCKKNNTLLSSDGRDSLMSTEDVKFALQFSSKSVANKFIESMNSEDFSEDYEAVMLSDLFMNKGEDRSQWQKLNIQEFIKFAKKNGITNLKRLRGEVTHLKALLMTGKEEEAYYLLNELKKDELVTTYP